MQFCDTTSAQRVFSLTQRIRAVCGGTSASKTVSILFWLIDYAQSTHDKKIDVVSENYPHLEGGAMADFEAIMRSRGYWKDSRWNKTKHVYTFETGSRIKFMSVDTFGKAHGPRRDVLFVNEANNMAYNIVDQLITRTREVVWLDWNPSTEFWFYTEMLGNRKDIDFITVTYKDNEGLDQNTINEIESHKSNPAWWRVYGEGKLGEVEGRIYTGWQQIAEIPHEARLVKRSLDFGYSNDPTAIIDIYEYNGGFILDERCYQKGMDNEDIARFIKSLDNPSMYVIADSSEPKSIAELRKYGVNVLPAQKGKDSVKHGIQFIQGRKISYTARSTNLAKEYRNYLWLKDRVTDQYINEPQDFLNHLLDALRYGLESYWKIQKEEENSEDYTTGNVSSFIY